METSCHESPGKMAALSSPSLTGSSEPVQAPCGSGRPPPELGAHVCLSAERAGTVAWTVREARSCPGGQRGRGGRPEAEASGGPARAPAASPLSCEQKGEFVHVAGSWALTKGPPTKVMRSQAGKGRRAGRRPGPTSHSAGPRAHRLRPVRIRQAGLSCSPVPGSAARGAPREGKRDTHSIQAPWRPRHTCPFLAHELGERCPDGGTGQDGRGGGSGYSPSPEGGLACGLHPPPPLAAA